MSSCSLLKPLAKDADGAPVIYIVPGLSGHALEFRPLARALAPRWALIGVLYPVFTGSDTRYERLQDLAKDMVRDFEDLPDPIILAGYSIGGTIAYEMACLLRSQQRKVALVMIDSSVRALRYAIPRPIRRLRKYLLLRPRRFLGFSELARPRRVLKQESVRIFDVDQRQAVRDYQPTKSDVPVVMVRAISGLIWRNYWQGRDYGWSRVATVTDSIKCRGNHNTIVRPQHLEDLSRALDKAFTRVFDKCRWEV